ncbi:MAG: hypothetical protein U0Q15_16900 [Kineosporiaceae bacterium]
MAPDPTADAVLLDGRYLAPRGEVAPGGEHPARDTRFARDVVLRLWPDDVSGRDAWAEHVALLSRGDRSLPHLLDAGVDTGCCWIALPPAAPPPARTSSGGVAGAASSPRVAVASRRRRPALATSPAVATGRAAGMRSHAPHALAAGAGVAGLVSGLLLGGQFQAEAQRPEPGVAQLAEPAPTPTGTTTSEAALRPGAVVVQPAAVTSTKPAPTTTKATSGGDHEVGRAARRPVAPAPGDEGPAREASRPGRGKPDHASGPRGPRAERPGREHPRHP